MKYSSYSFIQSLLLLLALTTIANSLEYRDRLDFQQVFSDTSEVTALFLSCGNENRMKTTLQSFLAHFTYPLKQIIIVHCSDIKFDEALPKDFEVYSKKFKIIKGIEKGSMVEQMMKVVNYLKTPYTYLSDTQWKTIKGENFIEQAIKIFKFCQSVGKNCYQVTPNYPYWRAAARLTQMNWTSTGEAYHQIVALTKQYEYFTTSPSLIYLAPFKHILSIVGESKNCKKTSLGIFDVCLMKEISDKIAENKLLQIYINDGTGRPYAIPITQNEPEGK